MRATIVTVVFMIIIALAMVLLGVLLWQLSPGDSNRNTIRNITFGIDPNGSGVGFSWDPIRGKRNVTYGWTIHETDSKCSQDGDIVVVGPLSPAPSAYVNPDLFQIGQSYSIRIKADHNGKLVGTGQGCTKNYNIKTFACVSTVINGGRDLSLNTHNVNPLRVTVRDTTANKYVDNTETGVMYRDYALPPNPSQMNDITLDISHASFTITPSALLVTLVDTANQSICIAYAVTPDMLTNNKSSTPTSDPLQDYLLSMMDDDSASAYVPWSG